MSLQRPPYSAAVINALQRAADVWLQWFDDIYLALTRVPSAIGHVSLSGQTASLAATSIATPTLAAGLYQVLVMHRVTRADDIGSSLTTFVTVTESGLTVTYTGLANTSNAVGVGKSDTFNVLVDAGTPITYGTTYSSTGGAPAMAYRLVVRLQHMPESS